MTIHTQCRVTVPGWPDVPVEIDLPDEEPMEEPRVFPTEKALLRLGKPALASKQEVRIQKEESPDEWPVDAPFFED